MDGVFSPFTPLCPAGHLPRKGENGLVANAFARIATVVPSANGSK